MEKIKYADPRIRLSFIALFITAAIAGIFAYWLVWPDNVVVVKNPNHVHVLKNHYHRGEHISYVLDFCKSRRIPGKIYRSLVNGIQVTYTPIESDLPAGCRQATISDLKVPEFITPGIYHIEGAGVYEINPLREYRNEWRSNDFEILPDDLSSSSADLKDRLSKVMRDVKEHEIADKKWQKEHQ